MSRMCAGKQEREAYRKEGRNNKEDKKRQKYNQHRKKERKTRVKRKRIKYIDG